MMGHQTDCQTLLFYAFDLEEHIPQNHLLRDIDRSLDLSDLNEHLAEFYSHTGRPSIAPQLMIRMLVIGYCFGIRSERRLCEEVHLNLAYRWFCRLSIEDKVPDHSTFSKNRHGRFRESGVFRHLFETVLHRCMREGLVGGEGFAVDASVVRADANRHRHWEGDDDLRENTSRAVREYLQALDDDGVQGSQPRRPVSTTDPAAQYTAAVGRPAFYAYSTNYLIDIRHGIIMDVEPTPARRGEEVESARTMIERVEQRFEITPERLIADTAYGSAPMLEWLVNDQRVQPHIPVWDKSDGKAQLYGRSEFTWEEGADRYRCPAGKWLQRRRRAFTIPRTGITKENTIIYRAGKRDCEGCEHKSRCCPNTPGRKIARSVYESSRDVARAIAKTDAYQQSRKDRKKVEMLFAHLKRILKLDRLRLRGLSGAHDEFLLAATAQNLRRLAKLLSKPPPNQRIVAPV